MRVQLSEKSKAEFIELIAKDSITCWFEGDEFVMPSGQGKTAKGIVLGKLLVWQHRQTEVDELQAKFDQHDQWLGQRNRDVQELYDINVKHAAEKAELQKRVDDLEIQLADWKRKSMPAMLNGMCGRCGKEPLQGIVSDKEDYALLHCFSCGANKYEWIGEQALNGGGE